MGVFLSGVGSEKPSPYVFKKGFETAQLFSTDITNHENNRPP
jgi:hypothetical protein